jgi:hypothetical protein
VGRIVSRVIRKAIMSDTAPTASTGNGGIDTLLAQLSRANGESAQRRVQIKELKAQLAKLQSDLEAERAGKGTLQAELDQLKTRANAAPAELQAELDKLRGDLRYRDHKDAIASLYGDAELGLNKAVPVEKLMKILDYEAAEANPDLAALKLRIQGIRETDPYLFMSPGTGNAADGSANPQKPAELPPGANASRGASDGNASGNFTVTRAQMRDPEFMRRNQAAIAKAGAEGRFVINP